MRKAIDSFATMASEDKDKKAEDAGKKAGVGHDLTWLIAAYSNALKNMCCAFPEEETEAEIRAIKGKGKLQEPENHEDDDDDDDDDGGEDFAEACTPFFSAAGTPSCLVGVSSRRLCHLQVHKLIAWTLHVTGLMACPGRVCEWAGWMHLPRMDSVRVNMALISSLAVLSS